MNTAPWRERALERIRRAALNRLRRRHPELSPRRWSNAELRRLGPLFGGDIVNVSGWKDEDKENGHYRDYFPSASGYTVTNYRGSSAEGDGIEGEVFLDLQAPLPPDMAGRFDVAFCHTALEHMSDASLAVRNLVEMSRDAVVVVVPFMQDEHYAPGLYGDFWRFTPLGLKRLFEDNGMQLVYLSANDSPWYPVYLLAVASRTPERWPQLTAQAYDWNARVGKCMFHYPGCAW